MCQFYAECDDHTLTLTTEVGEVEFAHYESEFTAEEEGREFVDAKLASDYYVACGRWDLSPKLQRDVLSQAFFAKYGYWPG